MNNKAIYFIGGVIWALVSSRKAYAPNINTSIDNSIPNVEPIDCRGTNPPCPQGCKEFQPMVMPGFASITQSSPICLPPEKYAIASARKEKIRRIFSGNETK